MAGTILSPINIWKDFVIPQGIGSEILAEREEDGFTVTELYIEGRKVKDGNVKIYAVSVKETGKNNLPAVLLLPDMKDGADLTLAKDIAKRGYEALLIDLAGSDKDKERYTVYPESVSYANLKDSVYGECELSEDVTDTCWYEWAAAAVYAATYLKERDKNPAVGAIGINGSATVLWQVATFTGVLSCAVFVANAGWYGYRGISKFGGIAEPQFSDEALRFIAGVEPQSYAKHVKCPALLLSPTNSFVYDADRAYDTVARVPDEIYTAVQYSVGNREEVDCKCYTDALLFLETFLHPAKAHVLPGEVGIAGEIREGKLVVAVAPDERDLESVGVYVAEQTIEPYFRCWRKIPAFKEKLEEGYVFEYVPYNGSEKIAFFAEACYKNGFRVCSLIAAKSFSENDVKKFNKHKIIYSSRKQNMDSIFSCAYENREMPRGLDISGIPEEERKKGPMDLYGVSGKNGLLTFKINADKYKPDADSLMMLDVYLPGGGTFYVKLVADFFGDNRAVYSAGAKVNGGEVWQNIKFEKNKFKTEEGMPLKSYDSIEAIAFVSEDNKAFIVNNVLWV